MYNNLDIGGRWHKVRTTRLLIPQFQFLHNYIFFTFHTQQAHRACRKYMSSGWAELAGLRYRAASEVLPDDSGWNIAGGFCSWQKWTLARRYVSRDCVLRMPWFTRKNKFCCAIYHSSHLCICKSHLMERQCDTHSLACYFSRTTVWSSWMSKWKFCLVGPLTTLMHKY